MLQIMDDGEVPLLGSARRVSFKNSIIVMTSNLGSHEMMGLLEPQKLGFRNSQTDDAPATKQEIDTVVNKALRDCFSPEFINRFDRKVVFKPLEDDEMGQVLDRYVEKANKRYKELGVSLSLSPNLRNEMIVGNTQRKQLGVRSILRDYDHAVESELATYINTGSIPVGSDVVAMAASELQDNGHTHVNNVNFYYKINPELVEYLEMRDRQAADAARARLQEQADSQSPSRALVLIDE